MRFASLLHPAKHIQDDVNPRQQSTPFPKIARAAICTLLAASLTVAGAPSALAQDDATQQAVVKSEGAAESHSGQSQQMPASEPEPEPAQPVEPENEPAAPAGDAAPGDPADDTAADTPAEGNSPAANDDAAGASPSSENPTSSQTPSLDANAEPLSDAEVEDGETEAEEPEAQAETHAAGDPVPVESQEEFQAALDRKDPLIEVTQTIGDGVLLDNEWKEFKIDYPVEITSSATGKDREIWYSWFTVVSGGSLTLSGNLFVNGDIQGHVHDPLDCITVEAGGSLSVLDQVQILSDGGIALDGHQKPEGIAVVIEGGTATISTSSRIEGSSGGLLITEEGGTCTITSGTFATESSVTEQSWIDSGHAAVDNIDGTLVLNGNGSSIRIDSLENSGTLYAQGAAFEEVPFHNGTRTENPIFNNQIATGSETTSGGVAHTGTAWIYDCSFTKPNDGSKDIYAEGSTYVYAPTSGESNALKVGGIDYFVEAPQITWSNGELTFAATSASTENADVNRRYLGSNTAVGSLDDLQTVITDDVMNNIIAKDVSFSDKTSVDPSDSTAANMPYALAAFDFPVDGGDFFHVFGPTSELNIMSVDVQWGDMAFNIYPLTNDWNPATHAYEQLSIEPVNNIRPADGGPKGNEVWITNARSTRPIAATFDFTPEGQYKDVFSPISWYDYYDGGQLSLANYEEGYPLSLNKQPLVFSLNFDFSSEDTLVYSLNHSKIGTATVTIGYAS